MQTAARAPWALSAAVQLVATGTWLVQSIEQVPGPTPNYVNYGDGKPEFTTFGNSTSACKACIEFFPEKQDGERFHSRLYEDKDGGVWARSCRAGACDFRDPQTQPVGGVIGKGVGPGGEPDGRTCLTREPTPWYSDCEPIVLAAASTVTEVTRYCSYREQMFLPPPAGAVSYFAGSKDNSWSRIGGSHEQCLHTIETQGANLMDTMTFCDSDLLALSGCCETVFSALNCVAETSTSKGIWGQDQGSIFATMNEEGQQMLESFSKYCVPLCQNTKEEFCENYPHADICVKMQTCSDCTSTGGLWCPKLESCHCPSNDPPCIAPPVTTPLQCIPKEKEKKLRGINKHTERKKKIETQKAKAAKEGSEKKALCKYAKFAQQWE